MSPPGHVNAFHINGDGKDAREPQDLLAGNVNFLHIRPGAVSPSPVRMSGVEPFPWRIRGIRGNRSRPPSSSLAANSPMAAGRRREVFAHPDRPVLLLKRERARVADPGRLGLRGWLKERRPEGNNKGLVDEYRTYICVATLADRLGVPSRSRGSAPSGAPSAASLRSGTGSATAAAGSPDAAVDLPHGRVRRGHARAAE